MNVCSFCGKEESEAQRLIAGDDNVHICDECIRLGAEILEEEGVGQSGDSAKSAGLATKRVPSPRDIVQSLNQYIIGQNGQRRYCLSRYTITISESLVAAPRPAGAGERVSLPRTKRVAILFPATKNSPPQATKCRVARRSR